MIDTVIFDIGMVLVDFRWRALFHDLGFEGERFEKIAAATVHSPWWNELDRGCMSVQELIDRFSEAVPQYRDDIERIFAHTGEIVRLYDYAIPWIRELKAGGYRVYVLSNWPEPMYESNKDTNLCFLPELDGGILSFQEKRIKPEREIYELLCDRYDIDPERAVFLDDNAANIEGARAFGLNVIRFQTYEQAKEELNHYLKER